MHEILIKLEKMGVVPVVVLNDAKDAAPLAAALINGGLPCAEITFRTDAAEESIRIMSEQFPSMLVGAGTVLSIEQVDRAVNAGAKFIVSPGFDEEIVRYCQKIGVAITPGIVTPSEASKAVKAGLEVVKFFPAEAAGGLPMLKALAAPFTTLRFMPTGGISASNIKEYLGFSKIFACGGSWMVKDSLIKEQKFDEIEALTKEAVAIVNSVRN